MRTDRHSLHGGKQNSHHNVPLSTRRVGVLSPALVDAWLLQAGTVKMFATTGVRRVVQAVLVLTACASLAADVQPRSRHDVDRRSPPTTAACVIGRGRSFGLETDVLALRPAKT